MAGLVPIDFRHRSAWEGRSGPSDDAPLLTSHRDEGSSRAAGRPPPMWLPSSTWLTRLGHHEWPGSERR
jgi:hypothetical protein